MDLKTQLKTIAKNHKASIQNLETKFDRLADKQSGRPSGSLPSNTQPNPRGNKSKAYPPPQSCNEHVNAVFTRSGSNNFDTDKIMARMDVMTIKMDAQYEELQSRAKQPTPDLDEDDMPMSREEEAKF
nr:reverse transcriptase domain-containing protein [Tanacetum cinerariifolium]